MFVLGDFTTADTLYVPFDTYDSDGASVTITGLAKSDIKIYKDGVASARASENGYVLLDTDGIDFDGSTGLHGFSIDLSDNSDAGFYAAGSQYWIHVNAITVDGQTVRFTYYFTIGRLLKPTTAGRTLTVSALGEVEADVVMISGDDGSADNLEACFDGDGLEGDTFPATQAQLTAHDGKLDTVDSNVDAILVDTGTTLPAAIPTAAEIVDEWETQSQADPTGFHVNVKEWTDTAVSLSSAFPSVTVTSMDNNVIVNSAFNTGAITADAVAAGALDGKGDWNTVVPDAAGVAPTALEVRQEFEQDGTYIDYVYDNFAHADTVATAAALVTHDGKLDTVDSLIDAIKAVTDALTAAAAAKLALSAGTIVTGTVDTVTNTHTPTTTEFQADDVTEATADHFIGRMVIFTSGALQNQATDITDYALVGGIGQFTVTALTEAPANNDTFIIV